MTAEDAALIAKISDSDIVALTLFGEARGEDVGGRIAVANVIGNRAAARKFGSTPREVCLWPSQFSCWFAAGGEANFALVLDTAKHIAAGKTPGPIMRECRWIADGLLENSFVDNTHAATHYLTASLYATNPPSWAAHARILAHIGSHVFMRAA